MRSTPRHRWLLVAIALAGGAAAHAGGCSVSSTGLAFGAYQPLTFPGKRQSVDRTSDATISLVCTGVAGGSYSIALGPSSANGSFSPRAMANPAGGPLMMFNVYREPTFQSVWGDGNSGGVLSGVLPPGDSSRTHAVYGKIPAGQNTLRVGGFSALLTMTVTYDP